MDCIAKNHHEKQPLRRLSTCAGRYVGVEQERWLAKSYEKMARLLTTNEKSGVIARANNLPAAAVRVNVNRETQSTTITRLLVEILFIRKQSILWPSEVGRCDLPGPP